MAINTNQHEKPYSLPHVQNQSFDPEFQTSVVQPLGYDGVGLQRALAESMAMKITEVGSVTYIALAAPGTAESEAKWQVKKMDETSGLRITFADGDSNFNNVATDLTALTYS